jgi:hypothetical protein
MMEKFVMEYVFLSSGILGTAHDIFTTLNSKASTTIFSANGGPREEHI